MTLEWKLSMPTHAYEYAQHAKHANSVAITSPHRANTPTISLCALDNAHRRKIRTGANVRRARVNAFVAAADAPNARAQGSANAADGATAAATP